MDVIIVGNDKIMPAITWASKQFGDRFQYDNQFPSTRWTFKFNNSLDATLFALKWV